MKSKEFNEGLNHLDQDLVDEYIKKKDEKKETRRPFWMMTVAAALALTTTLGLLMSRGLLPTNAPNLETTPVTQTTEPRPIETNPPATQPPEPVIVPLNNLVASPVYPTMSQYPDGTKINPYSAAFSNAYYAWEFDRKLQYQQPDGYADSLTDFFHASMQQFLQGDGNQAYSPVNVYMALAMLAETTDGNSRQQILDLFGVSNIDQLRKQVGYLWNAHYCQDGITDTVLANSLWLDDEYSFKEETAQVLADRYYASSFSGDLGSEDMNKQLQSWINENTGGLLAEQANNVKLDRNTAFSLASTVYFTASWDKKFGEKNTKDALFHATNADKKVPFMNATFVEYQYYWGENFGAVRLGLTGVNAMWLILPDEGYTVADILASQEYLQMMLNPSTWENQKKMDVNLSLPKFDVMQQQDLVSGMKALGVTDVFDATTSNFSALTDETPLWVEKINHASRVVIDEDGCKGAAFTVIPLAGMAPPQDVDEIDFVLDRPFLFAVTSQDNLPLFTGIVNEP